MNKTLFPLQGIVSTVITPFSENGKVDYPCLQKEIAAGVAAGVAGFLVPAVASEIAELSPGECRDMVRCVAEVAKGKAKIITSITAPTSPERLALMDIYLELGCDGFNANIPFASDAGYRNAVRDINDARPPFLILQDLDFKGPGIPDETLLRCFEEFDRVIGVKVEVHNSGVKYSRLLSASGGRMNVSSGWGSDQLIELLDRGVHAVMPSGLFEIWTAIYKLHAAGRREAAVRLFYDVLPVIAFTRQDITINRAFHKRYFKCLGIFDTTSSRDGVVFDGIHERCAGELINRALDIIERLPAYM